MSLKGQVLVVTGGAEGIGLGVAIAWSSQMGDVAILDIQIEKATAAAKKIEDEQKGVKARVVDCDVTQESQIISAIEKVVAEFGQINCLVNNAGTTPNMQKIDDISLNDFESLIRLNVSSAFLMSKHALPHIRVQKGTIANIASLVSVLGRYQSVPYCTTKGAIVAMTKAMAVDEAQHGVRVNCISPGSTDTPLHERFNAATGDVEAANKASEAISILGIRATIVDIGEAAIYLHGARFVTGIDLFVSGGAELDFASKCRIGKGDAFYT